MSNLESAVHFNLIDSLIQRGRVPTKRETADRLGVSLEAVEQTLKSLAETHGVVLHPHSGDVWVIHPFSASPTATWLAVESHGWWCPCMWCACGVANLVGGTATIHTRLGGEAEDVDIHIDNGAVRENDLVVHFAVPPRGAWDNVHHFCATVLPFRDANAVRQWSERHGIPVGAVVPIEQVMALGKVWYGRHADRDWQKWSVREAASIFESVGLVGEFWSLPTTDGGF